MAPLISSRSLFAFAFFCENFSTTLTFLRTHPSSSSSSAAAHPIHHISTPAPPSASMGVINMALRGLQVRSSSLRFMRLRPPCLLIGAQFLWTLLVIAIVGDMIAEATSGNPSIINYVMFCAVFAMLSLFYLIPASIMDAFTFHPILPLALDVANSLFWFCAAVALSVQLGVHTCNNDVC